MSTTKSKSPGMARTKNTVQFLWYKAKVLKINIPSDAMKKSPRARKQCEYLQEIAVAGNKEEMRYI